MSRRQRALKWLMSVWVSATYRDTADVPTGSEGWPGSTSHAVVNLTDGQAVWSTEDGVFTFVERFPVTVGHTVTVTFENGRVETFDHLDHVLVADDDEAAHRWNVAQVEDQWWRATA